MNIEATFAQPAPAQPDLAPTDLAALVPDLGANPGAAPTPTPNLAIGDPGFDAFLEAYRGNRIAEARTLIERLAKTRPRDVKIQFHLALVLYVHYLERERPMALLDQVLALEPDHAEALQLLSNIHLGSGDKELAADFARRCIAVAPKSSVAYLNLVLASPESGPALADRIHAALAEGGLTAYHQRAFHSALGKIYDRLGETDRAFHHFSEANRHAGGAYPAKAMIARLKETKQIFTPAFMAARGGFGHEDPRMVFIAGTPRSGSTLLERMLARHPDIDTAGERSEISALNTELHRRAKAQNIEAGFCFRHLLALDAQGAKNTAEAYLRLIAPAVANQEARWWIDKLPGNFAYLGLIRMLFPNATILHTRRHVLDTALSCYMQSFSQGLEFTNDLNAFAHYWILYAETMIHWRAVMGDGFRTVSYEHVVEDPETQIRGALGHIGADWREECLDPSGHDRVVTTASVAQVREPIHQGSVGRWERYAEHLAPMINALGGMKAVEKIAAVEQV